MAAEFVPVVWSRGQSGYGVLDQTLRRADSKAQHGQSDRARFGEIFVRRGLMPDGGGTWALPRIVGLGRALELLYTGEIVDAETALRIGLGNRVWPHGEVTRRYGVFSEEQGAPLRATFLIDRDGRVVWREVNGPGEARDFTTYRAALADLRAAGTSATD